MSVREFQGGDLEELPEVHQIIKLRCVQCGCRGKYDVGCVICEPTSDSRQPREHLHHTFSNYFRCQHCQSAGPFDFAHRLQLWTLLMKSLISKDFAGFRSGRLQLFDGSSHQTVAMSEEHLKGLLAKKPANSFLHTRLGNLFRNAWQLSLSAQWYEKAVALNPADLEARVHLHRFAVRDGNYAPALLHAQQIIHHILQGWRLDKQDFTEFIVYLVMRNLRTLRLEFLPLLGQTGEASISARQQRFVRALLEATGEDEESAIEAADSLLEGKVDQFRAAHGSLDARAPETTAPAVGTVSPEFHPSLLEVIQRAGLSGGSLKLEFKCGKDLRVFLPSRHRVLVGDGERLAPWEVASLRGLFRGDAKPPANFDEFAAKYDPAFNVVEAAAFTFCEREGDRTDQEFTEVYSLLRRRPDGKSIGLLHDALWQAAALALGQMALSQAEFEAIFADLARLARGDRHGGISRYYVAYLRGDDQPEADDRQRAVRKWLG